MTVTSNLASTYLTSTVKTGSNGVIASPIIISRGDPHPMGTPFDPCLTPFLLSMLNKLMLNSMLPLSMLSSCRCYSFDVNFFKVDVPVVDVSYFSQNLDLNNYPSSDSIIFPNLTKRVVLTLLLTQN